MAAALYLGIRTAALGEAGPGAQAYPYIHWLDRENFGTRTWAVWLQYCTGLTTGAFIETFLEWPKQFYDRMTTRSNRSTWGVRS